MRHWEGWGKVPLCYYNWISIHLKFWNYFIHMPLSFMFSIVASPNECTVPFTGDVRTNILMFRTYTLFLILFENLNKKPETLIVQLLNRKNRTEWIIILKYLSKSSKSLIILKFESVNLEVEIRRTVKNQPIKSDKPTFFFDQFLKRFFSGRLEFMMWLESNFCTMYFLLWKKFFSVQINKEDAFFSFCVIHSKTVYKEWN